MSKQKRLDFLRNRRQGGESGQRRTLSGKVISSETNESHIPGLEIPVERKPVWMSEYEERESLSVTSAM